MTRLGILAALALAVAAPARAGQPDDAVYAQLRGDAGNLLNQARSLAFDGLTAAPNLLGQLQTVATRLQALQGNAEAQALAGQLSSLHQSLASQVQGKDDKGFDSQEAQHRAVQAFRAKSGEITSLAQRAMTLAQPNSAAWPAPGTQKAIAHAADMPGGSSQALPLATRLVQNDLGSYGAFANRTDSFDQRFKGAPAQSPVQMAALSAPPDSLKDALAQLPAAAPPQDLERSAHPQSRNDVLIQQRAVNAVRRQQGLPAIPEDGQFGPRTQAAVCQFQLGRTCTRAELKDSGLGAIDRATSDRLALRAVQAGDNAGLPQRGQSSDAVKQLQLALNARGAHLRPDGNFGPSTERALAELTGRHALDQKTWRDLTSDQSKVKSPAQAIPAAARIGDTAQAKDVPGKATYYGYSGDKYDKNKQGFLTGQGYCTPERFQARQCDAITFAGDPRLKLKAGTPVHSDQFDKAYQSWCASQHIAADKCRQPKLALGDIGSCSHFNGAGHLDIAVGSAGTASIFDATLQHGLTWDYPEGLAQTDDPKLLKRYDVFLRKYCK